MSKKRHCVLHSCIITLPSSDRDVKPLVPQMDEEPLCGNAVWVMPLLILFIIIIIIIIIISIFARFYILQCFQRNN